MPEKVNHLRRGSIGYHACGTKCFPGGIANCGRAELCCRNDFAAGKIRESWRLPFGTVFDIFENRKYDKCRIYILTCETIIFIIVTCNNNIGIAKV